MRNVSYFKYENGQRVNVFDIDKEAAERAYRDFVSRNIREFDLRVYIGGRLLDPSDIISIRVNSDLFTTDTFTIGAVVAETLELTLYTGSSFGKDDIGYIEDYVINKKSPIVPFVVLRTEVERVTELGVIVEEIWQDVNLGPFYINPDGISEDGLGIMSIRASSLFTHPEFSSKQIEWASTNNKTIGDLIAAIKGNSWYFNNYNDNPRFDVLNDDLPDMTVKFENIKDMTIREIVNYIAILYGGYARTVFIVDEEGTGKTYLEFFRGQKTDYVYDESNYVFLTRQRSGLSVEELKCKIDNGETLISGSGNDTMHTVFLECPDMTQERLDAILAEFYKYNFKPATTKIFGNPALQVGDVVTVKGRGIGTDGANLPLHSVVYNITGSGLTMDVRSLFKIVEAEKKVKKSEESYEENFEENVKSDISKLYDRTTIQYQDDKNNLPLITLKDDYLDTKELFRQNIEELGNNHTQLSGTLEGHMNNSSASFSGLTHFYNELNEKFNNHVTNSNIHGGGSGDSGGSDGSGGGGGEDGDFDWITTRGVEFRTPDNTATCDGSISAYDYCLDLFAFSAMEFRVLSRHVLTLTTSGLYFETSLCNLFMGHSNIIHMYNGIIQGRMVDTDDGYELARWTAKDMIAHFGTLNYCKITGSLNANGCRIYNIGNLEWATNSQSEYTASLINSGTNENLMHGNMSYDSGEIRWCWKETVFTYAESDVDPETDEWIYTGRNICYVELPIFMAENIQNDYHINVSKMSWGDYRIIEKTPYYFILESQEENFAFTFEVVAKLKDGAIPDNNAIIANIGYDEVTTQK